MARVKTTTNVKDKKFKTKDVNVLISSKEEPIGFFTGFSECYSNQCNGRLTKTFFKIRNGKKVFTCMHCGSDDKTEPKGELIKFDKEEMKGI